MAVYFYKSNSGDGWKNLATDRYFLENLNKDDILLYFYVNEKAVIIGKNQNAWKECNLNRMVENGVQLVRRHTGGGAVYHDEGNLNFSFIMGERNYDLTRQFGVIIAALKKFGLTAELSGRNDILVGDRKFSGNAFAMHRGMNAHHGTLLIHADLSQLANYLNVSEKKIRSKGISSVRSRVCNLSELNEELTVAKMEEALKEAFAAEYGEFEEYTFDEAAEARIAELYEQQSSWQWRLGNSPKFDYEIYERFSFGEMQIMLSFQHAVVTDVQVYTDALDTEIAEEVRALLKDMPFDLNKMAGVLEENGKPQMCEIAAYMRTLEL